MSSYRTDTFRLFTAKSKVKCKAKTLEQRLTRARKKYEQLLAESFCQKFFLKFRVTIFGSSRIKNPHSEFYKFVFRLTRSLGQTFPVDIVTGGGGGLMLAASSGLRAAQKESPQAGQNIGVLADLKNEIGRNWALDVKENFAYFSTRLEEFIRISNGIYLAPGGLGTLLETLMFLQLKQKNILESSFPILAHPFWQPIFNPAINSMFDFRLLTKQTTLISVEDREMVKFTKSVPEITKIFRKSYEDWLKLKKTHVGR